MPTVVQVAALACKAFIAVLLLTAGGAKLADLAGFAGTVRLFVPAPALRSQRASLLLAGGIAAGELAAGAVSLSLPKAGWANLAVLMICVAFLATWTVGYLRHRGRSCRCFGALSARGFNRAGIARTAALVVAALVAAVPVPTAAVELGLGAQLALLAGGALVAGAAFSAASALGRSRGFQGVAPLRPAQLTPRQA